MENTNILLAMLAGVGMIVALAILSLIYFRTEIFQWVAGLDKPSEEAIQKHSAELLAQMDRNVAARKTNVTNT